MMQIPDNLLRDFKDSLQETTTRKELVARIITLSEADPTYGTVRVGGDENRSCRFPADIRTLIQLNEGDEVYVEESADLDGTYVYKGFANVGPNNLSTVFPIEDVYRNPVTGDDGDPIPDTTGASGAKRVDRRKTTQFDGAGNAINQSGDLPELPEGVGSGQIPGSAISGQPIPERRIRWRKDFGHNHIGTVAKGTRVPHSATTGLSADDHLLYLPADGSRRGTGPIRTNFKRLGMRTPLTPGKNDVAYDYRQIDLWDDSYRYNARYSPLVELEQPGLLRAWNQIYHLNYVYPDDFPAKSSVWKDPEPDTQSVRFNGNAWLDITDALVDFPDQIGWSASFVVKFDGDSASKGGTLIKVVDGDFFYGINLRGSGFGFFSNGTVPEGTNYAWTGMDGFLAGGDNYFADGFTASIIFYVQDLGLDAPMDPIGVFNPQRVRMGAFVTLYKDTYVSGSLETMHIRATTGDTESPNDIPFLHYDDIPRLSRARQVRFMDGANVNAERIAVYSKVLSGGGFNLTMSAWVGRYDLPEDFAKDPPIYDHSFGDYEAEIARAGPPYAYWHLSDPKITAGMYGDLTYDDRRLYQMVEHNEWRKVRRYDLEYPDFARINIPSPIDGTIEQVAKEEQGIGLDGTFVGNPRWSAGLLVDDPNTDGALHFTGIANSLILPADVMAGHAGDWSISFLINHPGTDEYLINMGDGSDSARIVLFMSGNSFGISDNLGQAIYGTISPNVTHHVVVVMEGGVSTCYLDNAVLGTAAGYNHTWRNVPLQVMGTGSGDVNQSAVLDELIFWKEAIDTDKIAALYAAATGGADYRNVALSAPLPRAYYRLGDAARFNIEAFTLGDLGWDENKLYGYVDESLGALKFVRWHSDSDPDDMPNVFTTKGDIVVSDSTGTAHRLGVGANDYLLTADSAQPYGIKWAAPPATYTNPLTTKGDVLVAAAAGVQTRLPVGTDGQVLAADSTQTLGLAWTTNTAFNTASSYTLTGQWTWGNSGGSDWRLRIWRNDNGTTVGASTYASIQLAPWNRPASGLYTGEIQWQIDPGSSTYAPVTMGVYWDDSASMGKGSLYIATRDSTASGTAPTPRFYVTASGFVSLPTTSKVAIEAITKTAGTVMDVGKLSQSSIRFWEGGFTDNGQQITFGFYGSPTTAQTWASAAIGYINTTNSTYGDVFIATRNVSTDTQPTIRFRVHTNGDFTFGNQRYTFPTTSGSSGYVLSTNGSGVLSWAAPAGVLDPLTLNQFIGNNGAVNGTPRGYWLKLNSGTAAPALRMSSADVLTIGGGDSPNYNLQIDMTAAGSVIGQFNASGLTMHTTTSIGTITSPLLVGTSTDTGDTTYLKLNHSGAFSATNIENRLDFTQGATVLGRVANYYAGSTTWGLKFYGYTGGATTLLATLTPAGLLTTTSATLSGTLTLTGATVAGTPTWASAQTLPGLTLAQGTLTTDAQALSATATWNNSGVTFTALKLDITNTASAAASRLLDLQVGGARQFAVLAGGQIEITSGGLTVATTGAVRLVNNGLIAGRNVGDTANINLIRVNTSDLVAIRDLVTVDASGNVAGVAALTTTGVVTAPNGAAATPSLRFASEQTGLYRGAGPVLGFSVAGAAQATLNSLGQLSLPTTGSSAGIAIGGDTALYRSAASTLTVAANLVGNGALSLASSLTVLSNGATITGTTTLIGPLTVRTDTQTIINAATYADPQFSGTGFNYNRYRGTFASPTAVASGDVMGYFNGYAYDGTAIRQLVAMRFDVDTYTGTDDVSGRWLLYCRPTGVGASLVEAMRVGGTGQISFPVTGSSAGILIGGDVQLYRSAADVLGLGDGDSIAFGTTTGTKIGTGTSQKLSFWNKAPIVQPTTSIAGATFVANSGTAVNDASTFGGYTLKQIAAALVNIGILA